MFNNQSVRAVPWPLVRQNPSRMSRKSLDPLMILTPPALALLFGGGRVVLPPVCEDQVKTTPILLEERQATRQVRTDLSPEIVRTEKLPMSSAMVS